MGATNDDIKRRRSRIVPCRLNKHLAAPTVASRGETKMFWFCAALSAAGVLESVICSCLLAEVAGYWLHPPLPSEKVAQLSRSHMGHHPILYGPTPANRPASYKDATHGR